MIENQEIGFKKVGTELLTVIGLHQILAVTHNYYMLGATTKLSMPFQVLGLWLHLKEIFFLGLGLTVTEINIKKGQKQENENVKKCRDGMPKSMRTR